MAFSLVNTPIGESERWEIGIDIQSLSLPCDGADLVMAAVARPCRPSHVLSFVLSKPLNFNGWVLDLIFLNTVRPLCLSRTSLSTISSTGPMYSAKVVALFSNFPHVLLPYTSTCFIEGSIIRHPITVKVLSMVHFWGQCKWPWDFHVSCNLLYWAKVLEMCWNSATRHLQASRNNVEIVLSWEPWGYKLLVSSALLLSKAGVYLKRNQEDVNHDVSQQNCGKLFAFCV